MNLFDPSNSQAMQMFNYVAENVFMPEDQRAIYDWTYENLFDLRGLGDDLREALINGYKLSLSGPGICRVLAIGGPPPQGIDTDIIPLITDVEALCQ